MPDYEIPDWSPMPAGLLSALAGQPLSPQAVQATARQEAANRRFLGLPDLTGDPVRDAAAEARARAAQRLEEIRRAQDAGQNYGDEELPWTLRGAEADLRATNRQAAIPTPFIRPGTAVLPDTGEIIDFTGAVIGRTLAEAGADDPLNRLLLAHVLQHGQTVAQNPDSFKFPVYPELRRNARPLSPGAQRVLEAVNAGQTRLSPETLNALIGERAGQWKYAGPNYGHLAARALTLATIATIGSAMLTPAVGGILAPAIAGALTSGVSSRFDPKATAIGAVGGAAGGAAGPLAGAAGEAVGGGVGGAVAAGAVRGAATAGTTTAARAAMGMPYDPWDVARGAASGALSQGLAGTLDVPDWTRPVLDTGTRTLVNALPWWPQGGAAAGQQAAVQAGGTGPTFGPSGAWRPPQTTNAPRPGSPPGSSLPRPPGTTSAAQAAATLQEQLAQTAPDWWAEFQRQYLGPPASTAAATPVSTATATAPVTDYPVSRALTETPTYGIRAGRRR